MCYRWLFLLQWKSWLAQGEAWGQENRVLLLAMLPPARGQANDFTQKSSSAPLWRDQQRLLRAFAFPPALGFILAFNQEPHEHIQYLHSMVLLTPHRAEMHRAYFCPLTQGQPCSTARCPQCLLLSSPGAHAVHLNLEDIIQTLLEEGTTWGISPQRHFSVLHLPVLSSLQLAPLTVFDWCTSSQQGFCSFSVKHHIKSWCCVQISWNETSWSPHLSFN